VENCQLHRPDGTCLERTTHNDATPIGGSVAADGPVSSVTACRSKNEGVSVERRQAKAVRSLTKVLPQGTVVKAYGVGRANARMTRAAAGIIIGFAFVYAAVAVLTGRLLIPGLLLLALSISAVKPARGLGVTDHGITVVSTSAWNGQPKAVLGQVPLAVFSPQNVEHSGKRATRVRVGADVVRLRARDYERLSAAGVTDEGSAPVGATGWAGVPPVAPASGWQSPATAPPGWYPIEGDQYRRGYWTGTSWSSFVHWDGSSWVESVGSRS
jgi:hypothetical protein